MKTSSAVIFLGGLASIAWAQDSDSCDPQNDSNRDATCSGSAGTAAATTNGPATSTNPRISQVVSTDSSIVLSTSVNTDTMYTSLPHSLDTVTSQYTSQVVVTRGSTYTTNTLDNISMTGTAGGAASTGNNGNDNDNGDGSNGGAAAGAAGSNGDSSSTHSSSSTDSGAMPTAMGNLLPAGAMAAVFGLAAAL